MVMRRSVRDRVDRARQAVVDSQADTCPEIGTLVAGKYRIDRVIGSGAMGAVFAADDEALGRRVAVKTMWKEHVRSPELVQRFLNEARAAARIESEHVARIFDLGQTALGAPFIVLELLEGADLAQTVESRASLPVPEVVGWVMQALEGIAEAHALGILHRDLKPANLFLARKRDGTSSIKIIDFGISKDLRALPVGPALTTTTGMLGSPAYMAPEQLRDARTVDARADIWAIGIILYELLAGDVPFRATSVADLCVAIHKHDFAPVRSHRPDVPASLDDVVRRCLALDADARFPNVASLAEALVPFAPTGADVAAKRICYVLRNAGSRLPQGGAKERLRRPLRAAAAVAVTASLVAVAARYLGTHSAVRSPALSHDLAHGSVVASPQQAP
jgi:serine/threonine-protein kinase